ncbi:MAG: L-2-hydroxyglutarate oxidase [Chloroflexota bacterium]
MIEPSEAAERPDAAEFAANTEFAGGAEVGGLASKGGTGSASNTDHADVVIIGAGIVGLATALRLLQRKPDLRVVVLEKEATLASHQTGHNSGVIHAGLYYEPGSLKARLCQEGKRDLEAYCHEHGITVELRGKLVVALDETELPRFEALRDRAVENVVPGLEEVGPERLRELEPHAAGIRALWSPSTGVVDFLAVAKAFGADVESRGGVIHTRRAVSAIERRGDQMVVSTERGDVVARRVIACAGLQADRVAAMSGDDGPDKPRIIPFRGDYYTLKPEARHLVRSLIYPVPDPRFPFLGVHLTRRIDGNVLAGPNAVLATAREGYRRRDVSPRDLADVLAYPGFVRLGRKFWRTGMAEMWRDWSKRAYVADVQRYVPAIAADHLVFGPSGVRAQALQRDGSLVDDFLLGGSDRVLHVYNAPSPAATSSLAIGRVLAAEAIDRFSL